jgi:hypothetical protein
MCCLRVHILRSRGRDSGSRDRRESTPERIERRRVEREREKERERKDRDDRDRRKDKGKDGDKDRDKEKKRDRRRESSDSRERQRSKERRRSKEREDKKEGKRVSKRRSKRASSSSERSSTDRGAKSGSGKVVKDRHKRRRSSSSSRERQSHKESGEPGGVAVSAQAPVDGGAEASEAKGMDDEESELHKSAKRRQIAAIKEKRGGRGGLSEHLHEDDEDQNGDSETALVPASKKSDGQDRRGALKESAEAKEGGATMEEATSSSNGAAESPAAGAQPHDAAQAAPPAAPLDPSPVGEHPVPGAPATDPAKQLSQDAEQPSQPGGAFNASASAPLPPPVDGVDGNPVGAPPVNASANAGLPPSPAMTAASDDKDSLASRVAQAVAAAAAQVQQGSHNCRLISGIAYDV